ncbi:hypothetical protein ANCCAN_08932 [Ancylostoma caninum]|uniref:CCHC-type domain-containing protein n=1 Tax=Ancylostoma caninum TaxID=29170 RepID=A0A368GQ72_ANCCA|nr:hypothetical protein ANCCAN_08932 [Ancylostoma caninum]
MHKEEQLFSQNSSTDFRRSEEPAKQGVASRACYNCGQTGHIAVLHAASLHNSPLFTKSNCARSS